MALAKVLGGALKEFIAGPPEPTIGELKWTYNTSTTANADDVPAKRLSVFPIKEGALDEILKLTGDMPSMLADFEGLLDASFVYVPAGNIMLASSHYTSLALLDAATPKLQEYMKSTMAPHFAGAPTSIQGTVAWKLEASGKVFRGPAPAPTGAAAAGPTGLVGRPTINMCLSVPADKEAEIDEVFKGHEAWMRTQHKMGADGDDSEMIRLLEFYISKGKEPVDPMDPSKGDTGNLLYIMSEVYAAPEGIGKHMEEGGKNWPDMAKFPPMAMELGKMVQVGACTVFTCLEDTATPFTTSYGQPGIHMAMAVPAEKEAEVDALWKGHEEFMRANHTMGVDGDDSEKPRLTSFYITKGKQPVDPMDPSKGETGNILYSMSETYAAPEGIAKHMELGGANWPDMPKLVELMGEYGLFMEVGATTVLTNHTD